jgi:hypothetical protein
MAAFGRNNGLHCDNLQPIPLTDCATGGPNTISSFFLSLIDTYVLASSYPSLAGIREHLDNSTRPLFHRPCLTLLLSSSSVFVCVLVASSFLFACQAGGLWRALPHHSLSLFGWKSYG